MASLAGVLLAVFIAVSVLPAVGLAQTAVQSAGQPQSGEFHIISRENGRFRGSHVVLRREQQGFVAVEYCGSTFWVRPTTVAWTQKEAEDGYELNLESSANGRWQAVCRDPHTQVKVQDLNLPANVERGLTGDARPPREFRFQEIRRAFTGR
ncbi:hypothetical protein V6L76_00850 [Pannonibacter sp. Pt2]|uniref:Uncharacterized protein n=1 Tax=Pannonibacter anstelovis TaxID=3121537 RepID=A0ABU7ZHU5_9HYPH